MQTSARNQFSGTVTQVNAGVVTDAQGMRFSARNQLAGTVSQVKTGSVNSEIHIDANGLPVVAIVTNDSAAALELAPGKSATALFKASQVVLAVKT